MKFIFIGIILIMVLFNLFCFSKSKKFLKKANENEDESAENYELGIKYTKISVVVSLFICLIGATAVIIIKLL